MSFDPTERSGQDAIRPPGRPMSGLKSDGILPAPEPDIAAARATAGREGEKARALTSVLRPAAGIMVSSYLRNKDDAAAGRATYLKAMSTVMEMTERAILRLREMSPGFPTAIPAWMRREIIHGACLLIRRDPGMETDEALAMVDILLAPLIDMAKEQRIEDPGRPTWRRPDATSTAILSKMRALASLQGGISRFPFRHDPGSLFQFVAAQVEEIAEKAFTIVSINFPHIDGTDRQNLLAGCLETTAQVYHDVHQEMAWREVARVKAFTPADRAEWERAGPDATVIDTILTEVASRVSHLMRDVTHANEPQAESLPSF